MTHNILAGKRGIIFGALNAQSLAWAVAKQCHAEGATLVLTNTPAMVRVGKITRLGDEINAPIIAADATNLKDLEHLFVEAQAVLGGKIDFVLHAVAMSQNMRRGKAYEDADYDYMMQTINVSALSFHKMLQTAYRLDALNEHASVLALTYIAADRAMRQYNDMADAKAMLQSITRNFGLVYAQKGSVRVNTISQSPTVTTAGSSIEGFNDGYNATAARSPLGNANAEDCAKVCVMMFSDYTRKITMQNIYHDGGFSTTLF